MTDHSRKRCWLLKPDYLSDCLRDKALCDPDQWYYIIPGAKVTKEVTYRDGKPLEGFEAFLAKRYPEHEEEVEEQGQRDDADSEAQVANEAASSPVLESSGSAQASQAELDQH